MPEIKIEAYSLLEAQLKEKTALNKIIAANLSKIEV